MASAGIRIVGDKDVTWMNVSLKCRENLLADKMLRADLNCDVLLALRHRIAERVRKCAREVFGVDDE